MQSLVSTAPDITTPRATSVKACTTLVSRFPLGIAYASSSQRIVGTTHFVLANWFLLSPDLGTFASGVLVTDSVIYLDKTQFGGAKAEVRAGDGREINVADFRLNC